MPTELKLHGAGRQNVIGGLSAVRAACCASFHQRLEITGFNHQRNPGELDVDHLAPRASLLAVPNEKHAHLQNRYETIALLQLE